MHWHHTDPSCKTFNIANASSYGKKRIEEELAKCALLCADCHAEVTFES
jgi:hypothetical protein